uniref:DUF4430 domain-containing protein n=1 Tax=Fundulus heteroclitus TaxID=8078 RepID=A0A3Q2NNB6_FUNHE
MCPLDYEPVPIEVVVKNSLLNKNPVTYSTEVVHGWILLGAMRKLMDVNENFKFSYTEDPNYGPFLDSVNGLAGKEEERTYWELLVKTPDGTIIRPNVGTSNLENQYKYSVNMKHLNI